ncbi:hypothetical protein PUNSTDRAFT_122288 [Punctularia strigosozonata HHB-11173 SS5]|uniref:uncharacterized protein n=1 Tax=Punctularia strigosozonata (strain HHB-11173) TaxID=741275 RepID=UPI0004417D0D|nr:uncharacterized protein PUNSTDRAFT_122288 [Punctularia strigosozonata HHB-11173 SS5]EIN05910.1 hypothetical protein PUNSTDRAFT_122288 [Punctularia strigosozonata HHB-11173 SS5]
MDSELFDYLVKTLDPTAFRDQPALQPAPAPEKACNQCGDDDRDMKISPESFIKICNGLKKEFSRGVVPQDADIMKCTITDLCDTYINDTMFAEVIECLVREIPVSLPGSAVLEQLIDAAFVRAGAMNLWELTMDLLVLGAQLKSETKTFLASMPSEWKSTPQNALSESDASRGPLRPSASGHDNLGTPTADAEPFKAAAASPTKLPLPNLHLPEKLTHDARQRVAKKLGKENSIATMVGMLNITKNSTAAQ